MNNCFKIGSPDVVFEEFGGEMVVLNLASGQYFGLNPAGAACWHAIVSGASIADVGDRPDIRTTLSVFAQRLQELGLVVPADGETPTGQPTTVLDFQGTPSVEVFNDLADLIVADPIHDVDVGAGWPVKPAA